MDRFSRQPAEREQDTLNVKEVKQQATPETGQPAGFTDKYGASFVNAPDGIDVAAGETSNVYIQEIPSGVRTATEELEGQPGSSEPAASAYIGETEKGLSSQVRIEGGAIGDVRLFDEADALFGKRTEVKDSNDRYANLETNYARQEPEDGFQPDIGDEVLLDRTGFVEVPQDAAQQLQPQSLAGNDNEWRAVQDQPQVGPESQGFIVHELEKRGEAETQRAGDDGGRAMEPGTIAPEPLSFNFEEIKQTYQDAAGVPAGDATSQSDAPQANLLEATPRLYDDQDVNSPEALNQPLAFESVSGTDSGTEVVETNLMDETPRLFDEPETSNVMVGMGQKDAFIEQANPIAEQPIEGQPPVVGYVDVDLSDDPREAASLDDDDGIDVI